jgi:hypothetical protein
MPRPLSPTSPPLYLSSMPSEFWFWQEFGQQHAIVQRSWAYRCQLVRMAEAQNWRCCHCGARADIPRNRMPKPWEATREHVVPRSKGGGDDDDNIVMACGRCNHDRGDLEPSSFSQVSVRYGFHQRIRVAK